MEKGRSPEKEGDAGGTSLHRLLGTDSGEDTPVPMDTNIPLSRVAGGAGVDPVGPAFTRERVFAAAAQGDAAQLHGLLDYLQLRRKKLTSPEFTDDRNGKTALLKALLNLKGGANDTIPVLLHVAQRTADLESLINSSYRDSFYKGQTALHVAIERRSFDHVRLLVQNGADVQAKANGKFFQRKEGLGFYFGELPLSLAACTNQPDIVSFLMENPHRRADVADQDSQGNTVLHTLAVIADDSEENTEMIARIYDQILVHHHKLDRNTSKVRLEDMENHHGLSPLKLAAKLGKIGLFKHMLDREFLDEETRPLSRKFTEWAYGPVRSSLYDVSAIDTNKERSVLEVIVFGSEIPNRPEMLQIEPLRSLLQEKWERFASKLFLFDFLAYTTYLVIFTAVACYRKDGQPPFPIANDPIDHLRCVGEIVSLLGAVWFLYKAVTTFKRNPPNLKALFTDGFTDILFFLQGGLLLVAAVLYCSGVRDYVGLLVLSLALAWMNLLYYTRGSKQMGIYNVMMQRMILGDLLYFLSVYSVLLFGFSAAIVALIDDSPPSDASQRARGRSSAAEPFRCRRPSYNDIRFTTLELFKFTIGMGDLEFTDQVQCREVFYILLISYIVLTYILLLNMLIALMGNTVERISKQSENIWNLQRAITILDLERTLPGWLRTRLLSKVSRRVCVTNEQDQRRQFFRVEEMNWSRWRSDLHLVQEEDPGQDMMKDNMMPDSRTPGTMWNLNLLLGRIQSRRGRHPPRPSSP